MTVDHDTKIEDLKKEIQVFCQERDWDRFHNIKELAIGASTESAELLEIFRFQTDEQIENLLLAPESRQKIADELADVLFFVLRISQKYGFDLSQSFSAKMEKNRLKYPIEKARGKNTKYDQY